MVERGIPHPGGDEERRGAFAGPQQAGGLHGHWPAPRMAGNHGDRNALDAYFDTLAREIEYKRWYFGYLHSDRKRTAKNFSVFQEILPVE